LLKKNGYAIRLSIAVKLIKWYKYLVGGAMNKNGLVKAISEELGITQKSAGAAVNAIIEAIIASARNGDSVVLSGFGTFKAVTRKGRKGRNPQTGGSVMIPSHKSPKFIASKVFKQVLK
jgi:DNA-binding protein HU-beta